MGKIAEELRKKYRSPREALVALGLDESILKSDLKQEKEGMSKNVLTRRAALMSGAISAYLMPKLAKDSKFDVTPLLKDVTAKNFKAKQQSIIAGIKKGAKLAKDANLEDLTSMLDHLGQHDIEEGADIEPNSGLPMGAEELAEKHKTLNEGEDGEEDGEAMKHAKLREFLKGKLSAEDMKACDDMLGEEETGGMDGESERATENEKGIEGGGGEDGGPEMKPEVTRKAMDAAIAKANTETEARVRKQFQAAAEAREFVSPWAGKLSMALDSATAIYQAAIKALPNPPDITGIKDDKALRAILSAHPKPGEKRTLAQDSTLDATDTSGFSSRYGANAERIGTA